MLEAGDQPGPTCCSRVLLVPSTKELQLGKRRQKKKKNPYNSTTFDFWLANEASSSLPISFAWPRCPPSHLDPWGRAPGRTAASILGHLRPTTPQSPKCLSRRAHQPELCGLGEAHPHPSIPQFTPGKARLGA